MRSRHFLTLIGVGAVGVGLECFVFCGYASREDRTSSFSLPLAEGFGRGEGRCSTGTGVGVGIGVDVDVGVGTFTFSLSRLSFRTGVEFFVDALFGVVLFGGIGITSLLDDATGGRGGLLLCFSFLAGDAKSRRASSSAGLRILRLEAEVPFMMTLD